MTRLRDTSSRGEYVARLTALLNRGLTRRAAETVVDAAMFGLGCTEGAAREAIQKALDKPTDPTYNLLERMGDL